MADLVSADAALNAPAAAFGGQEFYPDFVTKAGVLGYRLVRHHCLPDGNKRTAFLSLVEFVERNGTHLARPGRGRSRRHNVDRRCWHHIGGGVHILGCEAHRMRSGQIAFSFDETPETGDVPTPVPGVPTDLGRWH